MRTALVLSMHNLGKWSAGAATALGDAAVAAVHERFDLGQMWQSVADLLTTADQPAMPQCVMTS